MFARVARYEVAPERIEEAVQAFGEAASEIENLDGIRGGFIMVDHDDGRTMTLTLWDNWAALEASEVRAAAVRQKASGSVGGSVLSVETFEVARELGQAE